MPKRRSNADRRVFFDQLLSLTASRLKASGRDQACLRTGWVLSAFGDEDHGGERRKSIGVTHMKFPNGRRMELFHLSAMRRQEKEALARRGCATLPELLLVYRRALSLGLWLRPSGAPERARSLR